MQLCRREDLRNKSAKYLYNNCTLCADHFEADQFLNKDRRDKLTWTAVPTVFAVPNAPKLLAPKRRAPLMRSTVELHHTEKRVKKSGNKYAGHFRHNFFYFVLVVYV